VQQYNFVAPMTGSLTSPGHLTVDTLWRPSTVAAAAGILTTPNDTTGTLGLALDSAYLAANYSTLANLATQLALKANDSDVASGFSGVNTILAQKQETLTPVHPITVSGSTIACPAADQLVDGVSGLSLGSGTGASQRIALYESISNGHYFYGCGIFEGVSGFANGLGLWGGSGAAPPDQYGNTAGATLPHLLVSNNGNVGISTSNPQQRLHVGGNVKCDSLLVINVYASGSISAAVKPFEIEHPDPAKPDMRLRHWCVESDTPGGMVMYTKTVDMSTTSETFDMPDWFKYLTKNVIVFITPFKQFGSGWGECIDNTLKIHTTSTGKWNVLITADRNDKCATTMCPQEVEYTPVVQPEPVINMHDGMD